MLGRASAFLRATASSTPRTRPRALASRLALGGPSRPASPPRRSSRGLGPLLAARARRLPRLRVMAASASFRAPGAASDAAPYGFSSAFDSGNGELVSATADVLTVRMTEEPFTEKDGRRHFQWFHFRVTGARGRALKVVIQNAGDASYPDGWHGYEAFVSADRVRWRREPNTSYVDGELVIRLDPVPGDAVYLAYFVPYSQEQHHDLVARAASAPGVRLVNLGATLDGRAIDCLRFGDGSSSSDEDDRWVPEPRFAGSSEEDAAAVKALDAALDLTAWEREGGAKRSVWVIARQHPGESMASWWMEGFVGRLLDDEDPVARRVRRRANVFCVPCVNPDGAYRGHLRTNAAGANLNREWGEPTLELSPEVFHVRRAMDETGVDLMLDAHGDEAEPYCFIVGGEGVPGWDARRAGIQRRFKDAYARACPDFQTTFPLEYGSAPVGNVITAKTQVRERPTRANPLSFSSPSSATASSATASSAAASSATASRHPDSARTFFISR